MGNLAFAVRALAARNYRLFFGGQSISLIGTWMTRVATSWLVYRLTKSSLLLGTVGFAGQIPSFLLAPLLAFACNDQKASATKVTPKTRDDEAERRARMVETQIVARGVRNTGEQAMLVTPGDACGAYIGFVGPE